MLFRARKPIVWAGKNYDIGDILDIEEGNPRIRAMVEQSHHLEYANRDKPSQTQGITVSVIKE